MKTVIAILVLIITTILLLSMYKVYSIYDEYIVLKLQKESVDKQADNWKYLYELEKTGCQTKIDKEVKRQKDLQYAKDKLNNPNSGIITLPIGVR